VTALVTLLAGAWFAARSAPGVAFVPGQGPSLAPGYPYPLPPLWASVAMLLEPLDAATRLVLLNGLSLACFAMVAGLTATAVLAGSGARGPGGWLAALVAGGFFASNALVVGTAAAASPGALSVVLFVAALALAVRAEAHPPGMRDAFAVALLAGAAAGEMLTLAPASLLLLVGLLTASASEGGLGRVVRLVTGMGWGLLLGFGAPWALAWGVSALRDVAAPLLFVPPSITAPSWAAVFQQLHGALPWWLAAISAAGFMTSLLMGRATAVLLAAAPLLALIPFIHTRPDLAAEAALAPRLVYVALAAVGIGFAWTVLSGAMRESRRGAWVRIGIALVLATLLLTEPVADAPRRSHAKGQELGRLLLEAAPPDAIIVTGEPRLGSIMLAVQTTDAFRDDVAIVPAGALLLPPLRAAVQTHYPDVDLPASALPGEADWQRWQDHRPLALLRTLQGDEPGDTIDARGLLLGMHLWDLVFFNHDDRPLLFLAVSPPWLAARAQMTLPYLQYPRPEAQWRLEQEGAWRPYFTGEALAAGDPGMAGALSRLYIHLSEAARLQGRTTEAATWAERALQAGDEPTRAMLESALAAARTGDARRAQELAEGYLRALAPGETPPDVPGLVARALDAHALEERLDALLEEGPMNRERNATWDELVRELWEEDQIAALARAYDDAALRRLPSVDIYYQKAAVHAQLGEVRQARFMLSRAAEMAPRDVAGKLANDGRFALLITDEGKPADGAAEP
jgi:tetratricopeptide (TPR) repeat protein